MSRSLSHQSEMSWSSTEHSVPLSFEITAAPHGCIIDLSVFLICYLETEERLKNEALCFYF